MNNDFLILIGLYLSTLIFLYKYRDGVDLEKWLGTEKKRKTLNRRKY